MHEQHGCIVTSAQNMSGQQTRTVRVVLGTTNTMCRVETGMRVARALCTCACVWLSAGAGLVQVFICVGSRGTRVRACMRNLRNVHAR